MTWVKGKHTLKMGGEYRNIGQNFHTNGNEAGSFSFDRGATALRGTNSGNPIASFLLEQVASGSSSFRTVSAWYARADAFIWHVGDTYKLTPKLTVNYGLRWDMFRPTAEKFDRLSFFDPVGQNPAAGNRPGRLAFAGSKWGAASFGKRRPEETFKKGFAPRLGIAYAVNDKTVVRTGYGVFYTQAFYPGWGGGMNLDGFNANVSFNSTQGGLAPAFILSQGFPQNFERPPFIDPGFRNGRGTMYRPFNANRLSYSQQWNLSIERQVGRDLVISTAYVANKGTRLPSIIDPINALNPSLLSKGNSLFDEFQSGQTTLDGVAQPYPGWADQLRNAGCSPSVAQALLPYPQFCSPLNGLNEKEGNSIYHSFQAKVEKRFTQGTYVLMSYTLSKLLTSSGHVDESQNATWSGVSGVISPFERHRNKSLAPDDVPQVFSLTFVYELPFGRGKKFLGSTSRAADLLLGGWSFANVLRLSSPTAFFFRSSQCNIPGQFRMGCIPAILPGKNAFTTSKGSFDPGLGQPLFNKDAFEPVSVFNFYPGVGPRVSNLRGFGYKNDDLALYKDFHVTEKMKFQLRGEFFNLFNLHNFTGFTGGQNWYWSGAFNTDLASPDFGKWNGSVTQPRNIQLGARFEF